MNNSVVGLDIAKNIFHCYSLGTDGKATKKKLKRAEYTVVVTNNSYSASANAATADYTPY